MYNRHAMMNTLSFQHNIPLRALNSFGVEAKAAYFTDIHTVDDLQAVYANQAICDLPRLILGGGNNILLTKDFDGIVLRMANKGITIEAETNEFTYIRACAGEDWPQFVLWTLNNGLSGLENLSLIPGTVGAAPIQNIGAYGAEMQDHFHTLTAFDFESGNVKTFSKEQCDFGYRDSIFKHALSDKMAIIDVTFALPKKWVANTRYADIAQALTARGIYTPTAKDISDIITAIRQRKLPDPSKSGNAGSFFKNPVVNAQTRDALLEQHPNLVSYPHNDTLYRLAAGWLIDQCGWKGKTVGNAGVYETQALVLVNRGGAKGAEILQLAKQIQADVEMKFGIALEPEPVII